MLGTATLHHLIQDGKLVGRGLSENLLPRKSGQSLFRGAEEAWTFSLSPVGLIRAGCVFTVTLCGSLVRIMWTQAARV